MLGYVTGDMYRQRKPRPLFRIPETVNGLYDMAVLEHDRPAVIHSAEQFGWAQMPDWRSDRQILRIALYCSEKLHLEAPERVAIVGQAHPFWCHAEFALLALRAVPVGIEHDVSDELLRETLASNDVRVAFATDAASASRLHAARAHLPRLAHIIAPDVVSDDAQVTTLAALLDQANVLDTAERASKVRELMRSATVDDPCGDHVRSAAHGAPGVVRLTQGEAMVRAKDHLARFAARAGDVTYVAGDRVTMTSRLATYVYVGDGRTTLAYGTRGKSAEEMRTLRPTALLASPEFLEQMWHDVTDGRPNIMKATPGLARLGSGARARKMQRVFAEATGGRVRCIEPTDALPESLSAALAQVALLLDPAGGPPRRPGDARTRREVGEVTIGSTRLRAEVR
ncbi:MAG TPA: AMP-binding protein [Gemmatimonadaceae bacterium]|nr:AMP-binding protein [Gemmatimonadaceae bacterium]